MIHQRWNLYELGRCAPRSVYKLVAESATQEALPSAPGTESWAEIGDNYVKRRQANNRP